MIKQLSFWISALFVSASLFANDECVEPPTPPPPAKKLLPKPKGHANQMAAAYNAPCRIDVRESWDLFTSSSFLYWQMSQDNMEIAFADELNVTAYTSENQIKGNTVAMDFSFLPGFKVALGVCTDQDAWDAKIEYTMLHGTSSSSTNGVIAKGSSSEQGPLFPMWGNNATLGSNVFNDASENWRSNLDVIDMTLSRRYCVGKSLLFRTSYGGRAAWILQNVHVQYVNSSFSNFTPGTVDIYERSHCWSLGPRILLLTDWVIGQGFRFFGTAGGDLLYTKYKLQTKTNFIVAADGQTKFFIGREIVSALRTHLDMDLGLGWGSYFSDNN